MPRIFYTARRLNSILRGFPKLAQKLDSICVEYHHIQENFSCDIDTNGERWLLQTLASRNLLQNNLFDVGANHGDWAALALKENPAAKIHCFEICPPTFQKLFSRLADKGENVVLNPFGLSDMSGEVKINYYPDGDFLSTLFDGLYDRKVEALNVRVMRGKDYCSSLNIKKMDFLKLDVEGAEHLVLWGFDDLLTPTSVPVVQFEYGMVNILTKFLLRDFYQFFEGRGYQVGKLFPKSVRFRPYRFEDEDFRGLNYVAVSPQIAPLLAKKNIH
jgi:FkbM family methyltransferase